MIEKYKTKPLPISDKEMRSARLEIAVQICYKYPTLFKKLYGNTGYVMAEKEAIASEVLKGLCEADPIIKTISSQYYK
jgi:hypothetical protein